MTGVEILATQEVVIDYIFDWQIYFIVLAVSIIFVGILSIISLYPDVIIGITVGCITGALIGLLVGLIPANMTTPSEYETRYKVIISDEVSMNEFLARYEIIDQEGKIYTVREIDD